MQPLYAEGNQLINQLFPNATKQLFNQPPAIHRTVVAALDGVPGDGSAAESLRGLPQQDSLAD